ncbi:MAG TPA: acyl carrier protein [Bacteroidales bacterium]|jgi:acyl carrier protein|nr:acyl carrier protein [Bacteroidales bacterium]
MEISEILKQVNHLFTDFFDNNSISLNEQSTAADVEEWDSLNNIHIITAIEKHFRIRFELNELLNFTNIGDMCRGIQAKVK